MEIPADIAATLAVTIITQQLTSRIREVPTIQFLFFYSLSNVLTYHYTEVTASRLFQLNLIFTALLTALTYIRRLYFHPLSKFPGHKLAAITAFHNAWKTYDGTYMDDLKALTKKHGNIIRLCPEELNVNHVDAILDVYAKHSKSERSPYFYCVNTLLGDHNLLSVRDRGTHARWRRIWDQAVSSKAIEGYIPRVEHHVNVLMDVVEGLGGKEIDIRDLLTRFTYDVMADLAFDHDAQMQKGNPHNDTTLEFMHGTMQITATLGCFRNLCEFLNYLPSPPTVRTFLRTTNALLLKRLSHGTSRHDIFTHLISADPETGTSFTRSQLKSNTQLVVVAGTDTTSATLTSCFVELAKNRSIQSKLHRELRDAFPTAESITARGIQDLPYLNACINETLRCWPAVPSGARYCAPSQGLTVDGVFIPPHTPMRTAPEILMKDPRYFPRGEEWVPERWTERPELIKDRRAFVPFSYGAHVCVGKQLAMNEMRLAVGRIVWGYQVEMGEGWREKEWRKGWRDWFTVCVGEAKLKFVPREETAA